MRYIYIVILSFIISNLYPQEVIKTKKLDLNWYDREVTVEDNTFLIETFDSGQIVEGLEKQPLYIFNTNLPTMGSVEVDIKIIKSSKAKFLSTEELPSAPRADHTIITVRREHEAVITINPFFRDQDGVAKKIEQAAVRVIFDKELPVVMRGPERTKSSVLADGQIYKFAVEKSGVYQVTGKQLSDLGANLSSIDASKIKVYTNYGGNLPTPTAESYPDDLIEIKSEVSSQTTFSENDRIIFFAEGASVWKKNLDSYNFQMNTYSFENYVYIKLDGDVGQRITIYDSPDDVDFVDKVYDDFQHYENDNVNLLALGGNSEGTGKNWYGDKVQNNQTLDLSNQFSFANNAPGTEATANITVLGRSENSGRLYFTFDGQTSDRSVSSVTYGSITSNYASPSSISMSKVLESERPEISFRYDGRDALAEGWLDFISIHQKKLANFSGDQIILRNLNAANFDNYAIKVQGSPRIWKVNNLESISEVELMNQELRYRVSGEDVFVLFDPNNLSSANPIGRVENQNVHGIEKADMIVIYHPEFSSAMEKYKEYRSAHDNLNVVTVNILSIYEEFASGRRDATALRDFLKMVYDRDENFRYCLLLGDGSYDYRRINPNLADERWIPVYETDNSINPIYAYPTDDYYAFLDDSESGNLDGGLDIAIGRLTVNSASEANAVVEKIIHYETGENRFGPWRLRSGHAADDEDTNRHLSDSDGIARAVESRNPIFNLQKTYFDAFQQENTSFGQRYPDASQELQDNLQNGQLVLGYLGHGGPKGWAQERVLQITHLDNLTNYDKLTLLITATCSFAGYDDPDVISAGERALLNPRGAAVALFTTTRAVFASENEKLTSNVYSELFRYDGNQGRRIGDIMMVAKNGSGSEILSENTRKFTILGDPAMRLALPGNQVQITKINDTAVSEFSDSLGALDLVTLEGIITDQTGNPLTDFNGDLNSIVFDKKSNFSTLVNDPKSRPFNFQQYKNVIFKGNASVTDGQWKFSFVIPKDINYTIGKGKISLYASQGSTKDAAGYYDEITIGGASSNEITDDTPPVITAYVNNRSFLNGDFVSANSSLIINLEDDFGINVTGTSIGHDLEVILIGPLNQTYNLNDNYEASADDYRKGSAILNWQGLPEGNYVANIRAWDISNNLSTAQVEFTVKNDIELDLATVHSATPNPTEGPINIQYEHNINANDVILTVEVLDISGRLLGTFQESGITSMGSIDLDLSRLGAGSSSGSNGSSGLYLCKIKFESPSLNLSQHGGYQKIVKI